MRIGEHEREQAREKRADKTSLKGSGGGGGGGGMEREERGWIQMKRQGLNMDPRGTCYNTH